MWSIIQQQLRMLNRTPDQYTKTVGEQDIATHVTSILPVRHHAWHTHITSRSHAGLIQCHHLQTKGQQLDHVAILVHPLGTMGFWPISHPSLIEVM